MRRGEVNWRLAGRCVMAGLLVQLNACGVSDNINNFLFGGQVSPGTQRIKGFIGAVVADEPNAALIGREVLATGGNAADAAVAVAFALSVTYPSRAGLGGGGACLAYRPTVNKSVTGYTPLLEGPGQGSPEAIMFVPPAAASAGAASRPAAVPTLARGMFVLAARYGSRPFEGLIVPAEQLARFGAPVSRAFARDLATVGTALLADPGAKASFGPSGTPLPEGAKMLQPELAALLTQIRVGGVGAFYQGSLATQVAAEASNVGGGLTAEDLRTAVPHVVAPLVLRAASDSVAFLPPPADGGLAAAAAFQELQSGRGALPAAAARSAAVVASWRANGGDPQVLLKASPPAATLPALPASTSFVTLDNTGAAVACALTMNNLFGTGRVATGTGMLLAASPNMVPPPLLAAAMAWNPSLHAFRAAAGGSGQDGAGVAVAVSMVDMLRRTAVATVPDPGRANLIDCPNYLPGDAPSCHWATDPRGAGVALGGE